MIVIVFESHATSYDNEAGIASGINDPDLSKLGIKQARELGERHQSDFFDAIFCSDLKRSYQTAEIAFAGRKLNILKDKRLRECDYGTLNGAEIDINLIRTEHITDPYPGGGESYQQTTEKMKSFLYELMLHYDGKKIMIIGSRATQYGLENLVNHVPLKEAVAASWQWQPGWVYYLRKI